jgi:MFS family permease
VKRRQASRLSPDYWRLWWAASVSNIGDGIRLTALPLLIATITRDPVVVTGVTAATTIPWVLFSLPAGALVDRLDRRRVMIGGQVVRAVAVGVLAIFVEVGSESVALIYVVGFLIGIGEVFVDSSSQAAIPVIAGNTDLERANSNLLAVEFITNDALGGPVGAWLFAAAAALPFGIDSASFLLGAFLVGRIRTPLQSPPQGDSATMFESIKEGVVFVRDHALLRGLAFAVSAANFALGGGAALLVLFTLEELGTSEVQFGLVVGVGAVGGFVGAVAARWVSGLLGRRWAMTSGALTVALGQTLLGLAPSIYVAATGFFLASLGVSVFSVVGRSLRQAVSPDRILGRVVTTFRLIGIGALPLGAVFAGVLAGATNLRVPYIVGAGIMFFVTVAIFRVSTPERLTAAGEGS